MVRFAWPVRVPVSTSPVTVRVKVPPGVELEVAIVSAVDVGVVGFEGNGIGLLRLVVELVGASVKESRMLTGSPVIVEPDESDTVTV